MTPAARIAAAIGVLDQIIEGKPAEVAISAWARGSRYAGSKDRAALRDLVFDGLRGRRSLAAWGDGDDGRAIMIGRLLRDGVAHSALFTGDGHAPAPLDEREIAQASQPRQPEAAEACDIPDWLWPMWCEDLGSGAEAAALTQQARAPIYLRVNTRRTSRGHVEEMLAAEGIGTRAHEQVKTALEVIDNERKIRISDAYLSGLVELQDAASQMAMAALPLRPGMRVLDYCTGGGGKALTIADLADVDITAHDIAPERTKDLPLRAARAGVAIDIQHTESLSSLAPFDLVLCDAPCSGSGTWRRTPDAKWRLTQRRLTELHATQMAVLNEAAPLVAPGGFLAYATCSVLRAENAVIVEQFCERTGLWRATTVLNLIPDRAHDGFHLSMLERL